MTKNRIRPWINQYVAWAGEWSGSSMVLDNSYCQQPMAELGPPEVSANSPQASAGGCEVVRFTWVIELMLNQA
jgi:hypothetical protein